LEQIEMKRIVTKMLIAVASGAIALQSGGCGEWGRWFGDALGDAVWLRAID
jgi:hypothetical protein